MTNSDRSILLAAIFAVWTIVMVVYLDHRLDVLEADAPGHTIILVEEGQPMPCTEDWPC